VVIIAACVWEVGGVEGGALISWLQRHRSSWPFGPAPAALAGGDIKAPAISDPLLASLPLLGLAAATIVFAVAAVTTALPFVRAPHRSVLSKTPESGGGPLAEGVEEVGTQQQRQSHALDVMPSSESRAASGVRLVDQDQRAAADDDVASAVPKHVRTPTGSSTVTAALELQGQATIPRGLQGDSIQSSAN
jgi:hypothetical protein